MKRAMMGIWVAALGVAAWQPALAQDPNVTLHVNPRWKSCAIQLDSSLTQRDWRRFTAEVALVSYFRPLVDARPMGAGNLEVSILEWRTSIDETSGAWNNTFVHPTPMHWLTDGRPLGVPGLSVRGGITDRIDVGGYFTKNVESNYGVWGAQFQYNVLRDEPRQLAASARLSVTSLFGPEDVAFRSYGLDLVASKTVGIARRVTISPYVAATTLLSRSHERSAVVDLYDETTVGVAGTIGAVVRVSAVRLAVEYDVARVNSLSFKVGAGF